MTFIIEQRHGSPSSGYVSSGFFAGKVIMPRISCTDLLLSRIDDWPPCFDLGEQEDRHPESHVHLCHSRFGVGFL